MTDFLSRLYSLENRVALVTGASSGIGQHLVLVLAQAGASVVLLARRRQALEQLAGAIRDESGQADVLACDLTACKDYTGLAEAAANPFGSPDVLVNAAGVNLRQSADELDRTGWEQTLNLNLAAPFFLAQALVPGMKAKGQGNIINIASLQSYRAFENGIAYGASKGGICQLTRAMAQAWSRFGITANALAPGFFPTELTGPVFDNTEQREKHAAATAIARNGEMSDLDGAAIFLASRASAYVTGQVLAVDGGYLAQ